MGHTPYVLVLYEILEMNTVPCVLYTGQINARTRESTESPTPVGRPIMDFSSTVSDSNHPTVSRSI